MALCCCVARLGTGRMVIIYIYYLLSTAWENIYNDLFSQQRGTGSAVQGWEPLRWRIERKRRCPVSSVRLVQTTEDTPMAMIYCVNLNMQIRSSGALIRALWIIMNVLQPGVMKVTHFLAMYFECLVALSLRWYNWCNATWHLALLDQNHDRSSWRLSGGDMAPLYSPTRSMSSRLLPSLYRYGKDKLHATHMVTCRRGLWHSLFACRSGIALQCVPWCGHGQ